MCDFGSMSGIHSMTNGVGSFWSGDVLPEKIKCRLRFHEDCRNQCCSVHQDKDVMPSQKISSLTDFQKRLQLQRSDGSLFLEMFAL